MNQKSQILFLTINLYQETIKIICIRQQKYDLQNKSYIPNQRFKTTFFYIMISRNFFA